MKIQTILLNVDGIKLILSYDEDTLFLDANPDDRPALLAAYLEDLESRLRAELSTESGMTKLWPAYPYLADVWREKLAEVNDAAISYLDDVEAGADPADILRKHLGLIPSGQNEDNSAFADFINSDEFRLPRND